MGYITRVMKNYKKVRNIVQKHCLETHVPKLFDCITTDRFHMTTAFKVSGEILEYIKTGGWITIGETSGQVGIASENSIKILDFLSEFGFIEFDSDNTRIRITDLGERFLELPEI